MGNPPDAGRAARVAGYRSLVARYGEDRVGDALLAKWRTDEDAVEQFDRLLAVIGLWPFNLSALRDEDEWAAAGRSDPYTTDGRTRVRRAS